MTGLVDAIGQVHAPAGPGARIVSLVPSITELLCDLGLAGQVVGRTGFCIHPADAVKRIPKVGGTKDVNFEKIRKLAPTHVVVNIDENEKPAFDRLREFVPHVVVTHPMAPEDNPALYRLMGGVFGKNAEAEALCARFDSALGALHRGAWRERRVLYLIWRDPWMTIAPDTYIAATLALVGWRQIAVAPGANLGGSLRYPKVDLLPLLNQTDLVLLSTEPYRFGAVHVAEIERMAAALTRAPGVPGVRLIDGEMTSWYGTRAIAGLGYLADMARELEAPPGRQGPGGGEPPGHACAA